MQKRAILLGGSGQIGTAVAHALLPHGWDVAIAHRGERRGVVDGVRTITLDREDAAAVRAAASGADLVLDCVAYTAEHAETFAPLAGDIGSLVAISTASVYAGLDGSSPDDATGADDFPVYPVPIAEDHPTVGEATPGARTTYSAGKAALERALLRIDGLPVTILRPGAIHGPQSPALREWYFLGRALDRRERVPLAYRGESRMSTSATVNIAEIVRLAAEHPGRRVLNAVDEPAPSVLEIGQDVFAHVGHTAEFDLLAGPPVDGVGAHPWAVPTPMVLTMQAAREQLGYEPLGTHRSTIGAALDWMLARVVEGDWRELFPGLARYGAERWFDYAAEDRALGA
ncbi:MAG: NAD-dependent epimerase/dehydratase family protein [Microcella sp.]|uniref:NAD-dependent epimerase/dehydratase family protein n=1 Tax=Microcella sp. TaxID=1913979 RepID=UPI003315BF46